MILTNEDLLAISQIVDKRLEIRLKPIEKDISALDDKVNALDDKVNALDDKVNALDNKFIDLNHRVESLESGLHNVRLFQENIILPRLNTIESCYLDTFNRYQKNADKMEIVYEDVDLLKKVAADHSEKLQKLA